MTIVATALKGRGTVLLQICERLETVVQRTAFMGYLERCFMQAG